MSIFLYSNLYLLFYLYFLFLFSYLLIFNIALILNYLLSISVLNLYFYSSIPYFNFVSIFRSISIFRFCIHFWICISTFRSCIWSYNNFGFVPSDIWSISRVLYSFLSRVYSSHFFFSYLNFPCSWIQFVSFLLLFTSNLYLLYFYSFSNYLLATRFNVIPKPINIFYHKNSFISGSSFWKKGIVTGNFLLGSFIFYQERVSFLSATRNVRRLVSTLKFLLHVSTWQTPFKGNNCLLGSPTWTSIAFNLTPSRSTLATLFFLFSYVLFF